MLPYIMRKKPILTADETSQELHRTLSAVDLTLMGVGAIIGAGVFVLTGIAAATKAGPAIVFSYMIAGLASMFAALAYAELATSIGGAGSAYNYAYVGFGELIAWVIGWNLVLEYLMSVATVAIGWSGYVNDLFLSAHIHLPSMLMKNPFDGGYINLMAMLIIAAIAVLLIIGVRQSARFNAAMVFIKLLTIAVFIGVSAFHINPVNWEHFFPFGYLGVMQGAALVFFAYIGFDALSTAVEEVKNPQRNVPIGIIASLCICTSIYILVSLLLTGLAHYTTLNVKSPVAFALLQINYHLAAGLIAAGATAGLTSVILVMYYGLTRVCLAISRDGLLPKSFATIDPQRKTPVKIIVITGIIIALVAGLSPIDRAAELVNIGTLTAFTFVCGGVVMLRRSHPELARPFKLPFSPLFPILGIMFCVYLMINLPAITWWRFLAWTLLGLIIYFVYGKKGSLLNQ